MIDGPELLCTCHGSTVTQSLPKRNRGGFDENRIGFHHTVMSPNPIRFTTLDQEVSGVVRAELGRARISQGEMASEIGMHPNVFGRKCRGQVAFSPAELAVVAEHLGLTASALTADAEERFFNTSSRSRAMAPVLVASPSAATSVEEVE